MNFLSLWKRGKPVAVNEDDPVPVTIVGASSVTMTGPVTVSNEVEVKNDTGNPIPVSGPLTDTQLRTSAVPVSGSVGRDEYDTDGNPVPIWLPGVYTNRDDGQPLTETITDGVDTWVYTWTYNASGHVTGYTGWVKQ